MGVGAIIGAAALGAGINASSDLLLNYMNHRWSRNEWNMQNEYDLPSNQIQRMMDAGMNPNLAMQNVSNGTNSITPAGLSLGSMGNFNPADILLRKEQQDADIANTNEDTRGKRIENDTNEATSGYTIEEKKQIAESIGLDTKMKRENLDILINTKNDQIQTIIANRKLIEEKVNETLKNIDKLQSEIDVNEKQLDVMDANIELTEAKTQTEKSQQSKNYADARKTTADAVWQEFKNGIAKEVGVDPDTPLINQFTVLLKKGKVKQAMELLENAKTYSEDMANAEEKGKVSANKGYDGLIGNLQGWLEHIGLLSPDMNIAGAKPVEGAINGRTTISFPDYSAGINEFSKKAKAEIDKMDISRKEKRKLKGKVDARTYEWSSIKNYNKWVKGEFNFTVEDMFED